MAMNHGTNPADNTTDTHSGVAPKVGHKKSRRGCRKCKARRVKCDEGLPQCRNCQRLKLECVYNDLWSVTTGSTETSSSQGQTSPENVSTAPATVAQNHAQNLQERLISEHPPIPELVTTGDHLCESRSRRLIELRLLTCYMSKGRQQGADDAAYRWRTLWFSRVPQLALAHENLLYAVFAITATRLCASGTAADPDLLSARERYWSMALREQRQAVAMGKSATDAFVLASIIISANAFAKFLDREKNYPYSPPMEWLEVSRMTFAFIPTKEQLPVDSELHPLFENILAMPREHEDGDVTDDYLPILSSNPDTNDPPDLQDPETHDAYRKALSYLVRFRESVRAGEPFYVHARWILRFPMLVPSPFVDLLRNRRPRALLIWACFLALVLDSNGLRWFSTSDHGLLALHREIHAIHEAIPSEWKTLMIGVMEQIGANTTR